MVAELQDYVIIIILSHQMVVLCNRIEYSVNYCVCVLRRMGLWEITLKGEIYDVFWVKKPKEHYRA
jgi:hypothetical protein